MLITSRHTERSRSSAQRATAACGLLAAVLVSAGVVAPWLHPIEFGIGKAGYTFDAGAAAAGDDMSQGFSEYEVTDLGMTGHCRTWRLGNLEWRFWVNWANSEPRPPWFN